MIRVIEDAATIRECQAELNARVKAVTTEERQYTVGFPGGAAEATVYYSEHLDFWMTLKPISNRYWNCGGIGYPFNTSNVAPHVEINPPLSGIDRRIAGAYLEDDDGVRYIGHSGKIGGGAKGVSKTNFLVYYPGWSWVLSGEQDVPMYVIGRLNSDELPRRLRDFTRRSAEFRRLIKSGRTPGVEDGSPTFNPEFQGTKRYSTADQVEADCVHGAVVVALRDALVDRGIEAFTTVTRDLYVRGDEDQMSILFEAKTHADTTSIYGAVGQLMFHGVGTARKLVAVLPEDVTASARHRLAELGIAVVTFNIDDGHVAFDGLDVVDEVSE
jgi:hypothetical protein